MADMRKKMVAALAAVNCYLQEEEAASAEETVGLATGSPPAAIPSQWSHSGRQEMMAMRRLIQLRVFDRFR